MHGDGTERSAIVTPAAFTTSVLVPVDGGYTMPQPEMLSVLKTLKARVVIPMHYFGPATLARVISTMEPTSTSNWQMHQYASSHPPASRKNPPYWYCHGIEDWCSCEAWVPAFAGKTGWGEFGD